MPSACNLKRCSSVFSNRINSCSSGVSSGLMADRNLEEAICTYCKESRLVCGFFGYDSLMVTDDLKHIRWYNAKSRYLKSMKPKLGNSMEGINAIIKLNENPRYWHIMYDKYRNVYYRFAEMPYKLAPNESPYDEPKGKEFSVIVLNADFEIIGETKFPGKKYFYKKSFVGREGLYISENNLENPQFDENKLVFTCFKIKNASPNK